MRLSHSARTASEVWPSVCSPGRVLTEIGGPCGLGEKMTELLAMLGISGAEPDGQPVLLPQRTLDTDPKGEALVGEYRYLPNTRPLRHAVGQA